MYAFICIVCGREGQAKHRRRIYCDDTCKRVRWADESRRRVREWKLANPERFKANRKAYLARPDVKERIAAQKRAKRRAVWPPTETLRRYGLSREAFDSMFAEQRERCAICGAHGRLYIDHDHSTGRVRGLLCSNCNTGLGMFGEDVVALARAMDYVSRGGLWALLPQSREAA